MAGRRPRLVHEGSPIIEEGDGCFRHSSVAASSSSHIHNVDHGALEQGTGIRNNFGSSLLGAGGGAASSKYKLQTKFVVGGGIDPPPAGACLRRSSGDTNPSCFHSRDYHHGAEERADDVQEVDGRNLPHERAGVVATSNAYKLRTKLVVGGGASDENDDSDDIMMLDEDECDHHGNLHDQRSDMDGLYPTSHDYESHCRHELNNGHTANGALVEHRERMRQHPNEFYADGHIDFASNNPMHDEPTHASIPAPIYHMPSPSISPLVVLDGANIAYNYSDCVNPIRQSQRRQPDPRGIRIAIEYFLQHNCRVQAVVPVSWYQLKPRPADQYHLNNRARGDSDAKMVTEEVEELRGMRQGGFLVAIPPGDDDDAYALALARREDDRVLERRHRSAQHDESMGMAEDEASRHLPLGGYVVSNDMFHDAIRRDDSRHHRNKLPLNAGSVSLKGWLSKKRISYSFANVGMTSQIDDRIRLDFVPNPRSDLIEAIDECSRLKIGICLKASFTNSSGVTRRACKARWTSRSRASAMTTRNMTAAIGRRKIKKKCWRKSIVWTKNGGKLKKAEPLD
ncbi:hypothetical protein ACHAW5_006184 [Stephanodiscus triporus]|uniref:RNase NYN domain-containing protein n=1 Tax=Stephanodiscus triporus TaxID=2934178 RepID=A0ABD3MTD3_9STRA